MQEASNRGPKEGSQKQKSKRWIVKQKYTRVGGPVGVRGELCTTELQEEIQSQEQIQSQEEEHKRELLKQKHNIWTVKQKHKT